MTLYEHLLNALIGEAWGSSPTWNHIQSFNLLHSSQGTEKSDHAADATHM